VRSSNREIVQAATPHPGPPPQGGRVRKGGGSALRRLNGNDSVDGNTDYTHSQPPEDTSLLFSLPPPLRGRAGAGGNFGAREKPQFPQHARDDAFQIFADFPVPSAKDPVAAAFKPGSSMGVLDRIRRLTVLHAIDFNDEATFQTHEINCVGSYRVLPTKPQSGDASLAKLRPENAFFLCRLRAQTSRNLFRHDSSPAALPGTKCGPATNRILV
jgi:hypothetical protein